MPELTSQDRESYQQLHDAASNLKDLLNYNSDLPTLKELTNTFSVNLLQPAEITSFGQLQSQVELTGGYLTMYQLFTKDLNSITDFYQKTNINKHHQELLMQYNQLKVSLETVDDDFLDQVIFPCSDPLFLRFLNDQQVRTWTQQLMDDQAPALTDSEVQKLTDAWGTAVKDFVEDARKEGNDVNPGKTEMIAYFFCIHDQLEGLYSELSTAVAMNS